MKTYVKCKACGYIMEAGKVGDKCPACGVPAKQFEPWEEKLSPSRKRILDLHIHPVIVHMPQAFAAFLVVIAAALAIFGEGEPRASLLGCARVLGAMLPLTVIAAMAAGIFDGKVRFRRVNTPLLIRKMIFGALFFAMSFAAAFLALFTGLENTTTLLPFAVLEALSLFCGALLGIWGSGLMNAKFPG
jgi:rubredoxin/small-conductance mechanosensitive channel